MEVTLLLSVFERHMAEDLWTFAQECLEPYEVAPSVSTLLQQVITAAQRLVDIEPVRWAEARANVRSFIDTMGEIAVERHQVELSEEVYFAARSKLCPVYPIC
jgi:hypothetical protein